MSTPETFNCSIGGLHQLIMPNIGKFKFTFIRVGLFSFQRFSFHTTNKIIRIPLHVAHFIRRHAYINQKLETTFPKTLAVVRFFPNCHCNSHFSVGAFCSSDRLSQLQHFFRQTTDLILNGPLTPKFQRVPKESKTPFWVFIFRPHKFICEWGES